MPADLQNIDGLARSPAGPLDRLRSATLGFAAGLRSIMPLSVLSSRLRGRTPDPQGLAIEVLASPRTALVLGLAALGEIIADKLPFTPDRVSPLALAGRVVLGGTAGALASLARGQTADSGATFAALGSVLGSVVGYSLRRKLSRSLPMGGLLVALAEDGLALALCRWAVES